MLQDSRWGEKWKEVWGQSKRYLVHSAPDPHQQSRGSAPPLGRVDKLQASRVDIGPRSDNGKEVAPAEGGRGLHTNELQQPQGYERFDGDPMSTSGASSTESSWKE